VLAAQGTFVRRRAFIIAIASSAAPWPLMARAQQGEHMRRIDVLMNIGADDPEAPALVGAFSQGLAESGWIIGRNARIDYRWYQALLEVPAAPTAATTKSVRTDPRFDPHAGRCPAALNRDLVAVGIAVDGPGAALAERLGGRQRVFHELQVDAFAVDHAGID
jgi:hypothetical protein